MDTQKDFTLNSVDSASNPAVDSAASNLVDIVSTMDMLKSNIASMQSKVDQCNYALSYLQQMLEELNNSKEEPAAPIAETVVEDVETVSADKAEENAKKPILSGDLDDNILRYLMFSEYSDYLPEEAKAVLGDAVSEDKYVVENALPQEPADESPVEAVAETEVQPAADEAPLNFEFTPINEEPSFEPVSELKFDTVAEDNVSPVVDEVPAKTVADPFADLISEVSAAPLSVEVPEEIVIEPASELKFDTVVEEVVSPVIEEVPAQEASDPFADFIVEVAAEPVPVETPEEIVIEPVSELNFDAVAEESISPVVEEVPADEISEALNELKFEIANSEGVQPVAEEIPVVETVAAEPVQEVPASEYNPYFDFESQTLKKEEPVEATQQVIGAEAVSDPAMSERHQEWLNEVEQIEKSRATFVEEKLQQELEPLLAAAASKRDEIVNATKQKLIDLEQIYNVACEVLPTIPSINVFKKKKLTEEMEKANENMKYFKSLIFKAENEYYAEEENAKRQIAGRKPYYELIAAEEYPLPEEPKA